VFYAYWDWRFLSLLIIVTVMDYYISVKIHSLSDHRARRSWLILSIVINLIILGYFKYFNFFVDTFNVLFDPFGWNLREFDIILPVGISFYIFETISYVVDVYKHNAQPARSLLDYAVFVTFFPRLVAGPIMRASQFLPQLYRGLQFSRENFLAGAQLFAQGLIKKVVVADAVAYLVDAVYDNPGMFSSSTIYLAIFAYSVQIYFDFSGYSDMACGVAKTLGFDLAVNFDFPYISQSITEFWRRWHISLSRWLKDYLYIPLGGNRKGRIRTNLNLMLTMLLGGLWHGAALRFIIWGALHGLGLIINRLWESLTGGRLLKGRLGNLIAILITFNFVSFCWIFFRAPDMDSVNIMLNQIALNFTPGSYLTVLPAYSSVFLLMAAGYFIHFLPEIVKESYRGLFIKIPLVMQLTVTMIVAILLYSMRTTDVMPFIYFRF